MSRGQFFAGNITAKGGFFEFDLQGFGKVERVQLGVPGFHNIENAIAASVAASLCGVGLSTIKKALDLSVVSREDLSMSSKARTYCLCG